MLRPVFKVWVSLGIAMALVAIPNCQAGGWSFSRNRTLEFYRQGDFEQVIRQLSPILSDGNAVSKSDSVFAFRVLGVVYASDPKTRELGRHCWMNLLDKDAQANLVDLFVGEELDHLWERTRLEHQARMIMAQRAQKDAAWMTPEDAAALQKLLEIETNELSTISPRSKPLSPSGPSASSRQIPIQSPTQSPAQSEMEVGASAIPFGNGSDTDKRSYWKRPGTWIAASMAAGVVGFTVYYTFGEGTEPPQKLYHVTNETASAR